ncbi:Fc.00g023130.m01.CDS01 [Cosmosporella sp. VM-42]
MVLKRKRSVSELSTSSSSVSPFNSPPSVAGIPSPFARMDLTPIHLHSRTLKRFRNSKPSDDEVHQRTLNMLYSAQQHPFASEQMVFEQPQQQESHPVSCTTANQQSLHRFWSINSAPTQSTNSMPQVEQPSSCDDCGTSLGSNNGDEMDVDGLTPEDHACGACGKHVCFSCSVSNLGEQRRCLQCAGRKVWIGGIGWTNASITVC